MILDLAKSANANAVVGKRGRHITMDILVGVGVDDFIISIQKGRVTNVQPRKVLLESGIFAIRAAAGVWAANVLHALITGPKKEKDSKSETSVKELPIRLAYNPGSGATMMKLSIPLRR